MEKNYDAILNQMDLFRGIETLQIPRLLNCLSTGTNTFQKNEFIFSLHQTIKKIGIMLSGKAQIVQDDFLGNRTILSDLQPGDLFGESFAFSQMPISSFSVMAITDCTVLFIDPDKVATPCFTGCDFHHTLIQNMLKIVSLKNIQLTEKIEVLSKRSLREKILSYLSLMSAKYSCFEFSIPFDRQALADYLCADRSALSAELSRLKREGYLDYHKNQFVLHYHKNE